MPSHLKFGKGVKRLRQSAKEKWQRHVAPRRILELQAYLRCLDPPALDQFVPDLGVGNAAARRAAPPSSLDGLRVLVVDGGLQQTGLTMLEGTTNVMRNGSRAVRRPSAIWAIGQLALFLGRLGRLAGMLTRFLQPMHCI